MRIDTVDRIELFIELFERHAARRGDDKERAPPIGHDASLMSQQPENRPETITLAEMLGGAPSLLEAFSRDWHSKADIADVPIDRLVRFLADNARSIEEDTPRSAKLLHYVYPVV